MLGPRLLGEPNRRGDYLLVLVLAAGMGMLFLGQDDPSVTAPDPLLGNWLGAASGVTWAAPLIVMRWLADDRCSSSTVEQVITAWAAFAFLFCRFDLLKKPYDRCRRPNQNASV